MIPKKKMIAIILKALKWLFTIALVIVTLFLGKFYLAKQDSIPNHIHEALRKALEKRRTHTNAWIV